MNIVSGITVFVMIWWLVFFMTLSVGIKTEDHPEPGHAPSAPIKPSLGKKALITTGISAILWLIFYIIVAYKIITIV